MRTISQINVLLNAGRITEAQAVDYIYENNLVSQLETITEEVEVTGSGSRQHVEHLHYSCSGEIIDWASARDEHRANKYRPITIHVGDHVGTFKGKLINYLLVQPINQVDKTDFFVNQFMGGQYGICNTPSGAGCVFGGDSACEDHYNEEYMNEVYASWNGTLNEEGRIDA